MTQLVFQFLHMVCTNVLSEQRLNYETNGTVCGKQNTDYVSGLKNEENFLVAQTHKMNF